VPDEIVIDTEALPASEQARDHLLDLYLHGDKDSLFREVLRLHSTLSDVRSWTMKLTPDGPKLGSQGYLEFRRRHFFFFLFIPPFPFPHFFSAFNWFSLFNFLFTHPL
jgi:hypothetical protein